MIVKNYNAPIEEKYKIVQNFLKNSEGQLPRLIEISNNYLRLKPHQAEIFSEIDALYAKNVLGK